MPNLILQFDDENEQPASTPASLEEAAALRMLETAEITAQKLIPWGSNYSFAVGLETADAEQHLAIYKPREGEIPLWDFPSGTLYKRELAAYQVSKDLGWNIVPPTVVRSGPHGIGSLQLYIPPATEIEDDPHRFWSQTGIEFERFVLFDLISNNADRKLTHCHLGADGRLWSIDHGLTFNEEPKLRTVMWQFVERPVTGQLIGDLTNYRLELANFTHLASWLSRREIAAFQQRIDALLEHRCHPQLSPYRNIPYGWW